MAFKKSQKKLFEEIALLQMREITTKLSKAFLLPSPFLPVSACTRFLGLADISRESTSFIQHPLITDYCMVEKYISFPATALHCWLPRVNVMCNSVMILC